MPDGTATTVHIEPAGWSTIVSSDPDNKFSGWDRLRVKKDSFISYLRFDLKKHTESAKELISAKLNIYLTDPPKGDLEVAVDRVYSLGYWTPGDFSWNERPKSGHSSNVASFQVLASDFSDKTKDEGKLYEIDLTSAIKLSNDYVTLQLSTESYHSAYIASKEWKGGEKKPELVITVSSDADSSKAAESGGTPDKEVSDSLASNKDKKDSGSESGPDEGQTTGSNKDSGNAKDVKKKSQNVDQTEASTQPTYVDVSKEGNNDGSIILSFLEGSDDETLVFSAMIAGLVLLLMGGIIGYIARSIQEKRKTAQYSSLVDPPIRFRDMEEGADTNSMEMEYGEENANDSMKREEGEDIFNWGQKKSSDIV